MRLWKEHMAITADIESMFHWVQMDSFEHAHSLRFCGVQAAICR